MKENQEEKNNHQKIIVFELSWEVCNKVGGIHTVITSKVNYMIDRYKENYFLVGPYFADKSNKEFQEKLPPEFLKKAFNELKNIGIVCHYGTWVIDGTPNVILVDFTIFSKNKNEIKTELWNNYKIDSLYTEYHDFDEPVIWAHSVGLLVETIKKTVNSEILVHAHEWLSGAALLYLKSKNANVATVFTTHATIVGRVLSNSGINFYSKLKEWDFDKEAYNYHVQAKHQLEKQTALNADVFTTVSEITSIETEFILGRKADFILPNGLNIKKFPEFDELTIKHNYLKNKVREFLTYYFLPYYNFDISDTLFYFIAGRYEFHAKGIDIFIRALAKLNEMLKKENSKTRIIAFFWIPGNVKAIRHDVLESRKLYQDLKEFVEEEFPEIKQKIIYLLISSKRISEKSLFKESFMLEIKNKILKFRKKGKPPLSTHELYNEEQDSIISYFNQYGLKNEESDKVKVIYYPIYLTGADGLLDLNYYESMIASHLGIFASAYEPWGYTPLEAAALGISSVTTDLAGFGRYILANRSSYDSKTQGIYVLKRFEVDDDKCVEELAKILYQYSKLTKEERIKNKIEANKLSKLADWSVLVKNYFEAHNSALNMRKNSK
ncbi:MAG: glycogen/starch synthase [Candidatus Woesearchaeota archaeon]